MQDKGLPVILILLPYYGSFFCLFLGLWAIPSGAQVSFRVGLGKSYGMPEVEPESVECKASALFTHCTIFLAPNCLIKCRSQSLGHQAPGRQEELTVAPEDLSLFLSFSLSPPHSPSLSPHPLSFSPSPCLWGWNPFLPYGCKVPTSPPSVSPSLEPGLEAALASRTPTEQALSSQ